MPEVALNVLMFRMNRMFCSKFCLCLTFFLLLGYAFDRFQSGKDSSPPSPGGSDSQIVIRIEYEKLLEYEKMRMTEPEKRLMLDPVVKYSFLSSFKRSCSGIRDWEPTEESLPDPNVEFSSCNNLLPGLAHLEHGYYLIGSQSFKQRKRDKVFRFSCSRARDDSNKFECDDDTCIDDSYQTPNEVVAWKTLPKEQTSNHSRAFSSTNFLQDILSNKTEGIDETVVHELEKDQLDVLKNAKVTKYSWIRRQLQLCMLEGHKPTRSLIQEYERLDPDMMSDQSYRDYYIFTSRFGTHVLDNEVVLGGTFFSVNLQSRPGEYVMKAEGGKPDIFNSEEWSRTLNQNPVPLRDSSKYIAIPSFVTRGTEASLEKENNFAEMMELEKRHYMYWELLNGLEMDKINHTLNSFILNAVEDELPYICPSEELHRVISGTIDPGHILCSDHAHWSLNEDRYLQYTIHFYLIGGICVNRRQYLGSCTDLQLVFPRPGGNNCIRFYIGNDCSGEPSREFRGIKFTQAEVADAMIKYNSFTPC